MTGSGSNRVVVAAVDDIFFTAKIESAAARLGITLVQAGNTQKLDAALAGMVPDLVIFDLNCAVCDPLDAVARIRSDPRFTQTKVLGFLSHVQRELGRKAKEAGFDEVVPRSRFSSELDALLMTTKD